MKLKGTLDCCELPNLGVTAHDDPSRVRDSLVSFTQPPCSLLSHLPHSLHR